ncbi:MAG TPA: hypothetical protein PLP50_16265 [Thermoanaerobaculia bacterium]|nr:hypothetical protein [Thermoanaerobaculia bacterium]HQN09979.1 hypothetical protein [Thermoanaerobaculia bacterium]HQP89021.1 hypothetical protein [Thermoanaerobaculia bacterium]
MIPHLTSLQANGVLEALAKQRTPAARSSSSAREKASKVRYHEETILPILTAGQNPMKGAGE